VLGRERVRVVDRGLDRLDEDRGAMMLDGMGGDVAAREIGELARELGIDARR
jgi:hypothetical protein